MAGSISVQDFGDFGSTFKGLPTRNMNIRLLLIKDSIRCPNIDPDTANAMGINTPKKKKPDEEAVKNKLFQLINELNSKVMSFLIENVTIKDQENNNFGFWRLRIRPDIPIYDDFVFNNQTIFIECYRKAGRLRINKIYLQRAPLGCLPTEGIIEGPVLVIDDENESLPDSTFMSKEDFDWMLKLTPRRKDLEERLEEWGGYLNLYLSFVRSKQAWIPYKNIRRTDSHTATISLSSAFFSHNAVKSFYTDDEVRILDNPIPTDNKWKPDEETNDPVDLGTIKDAKVIKQNIKQDEKKNSKDNKKQNDWFDVDIELAGKYIFDPAHEQNTKEKQSSKKDPLDNLPAEGLFVNSLFSDELPISLQQKAIRRLKEGSASNPKLEDFIFAIKEARLPSMAEEVQRDNLVEGSLNNSQLQALTTSLTSPDISLIQGPPGTGKTTVIAELCYQTVLRGGKVLLASQSNLAVDNALSRLTTKRSEIMPIRIGKRTTEEGQDFVEENVVPKWFQSVKENVKTTVDRNQKIISIIESSEHAIIELKKCFKLRSEEQQKSEMVKDELKDMRIKSEQTSSEGRTLKENINSLQKDISILQEVEKTGSYPSQQNFETLAKILPETVPVVRDEIRSLFKDAGIEIEKQFDAIDIGEILGHIKTFNCGDTSDSFEHLDKLKEYVSKLDHLKNDEIKELELRSSEFLDKISKITDSEEMAKTSSELIEITKKINELKNRNNELRLGNQWKETLSELRMHFKVLLDITKLTQLSDLQKQIENVQTSLHPSKDLLPIIEQISIILRTLSNSTFSVSDEIHLQDKIEANKADFKKLTEEYEVLKTELDSSHISRKKAEDEIARIDAVFDRIKEDIKKNSAMLSKTGLFDSDQRIDEGSLEYLGSTLDAHKYKQKEEINKSKRWLKLQSEWIEKIDQASKDEYESVKQTYIDLANVVGATCTETGKYKFWGKKGRDFDLVIIDEVSKATPPELLMPMLLGKQIILVGDHQQLPPLYKINAKGDELPVTESDEEDIKRMVNRYEKLVTTSYFKEMFEDASDPLKARLTIQYRMHPSIMNAINQFYPVGYKLECGIKDPEETRRNDLIIKGKTGNELSSSLSHLIWIDTSQKKIDGKFVPNYETDEKKDKKTKYNSRYNEFEVATIKELLLSFSEQITNLYPEDQNLVHEIALISFYSGQVRMLKNMEQGLKDQGLIMNLKLRIGTVDRFQGMESPIVIVSLVSSPERRGPTSFVKEFRRINVAFSRAQSLLVIVGSGDTFENVEVEIDHDGKKQPRKSYGEILNAAKERSSGNFYVRGYDVHE